MLHFQLVHFPIALLLVGALIELAATLLRKETWHTVGLVFLVCGVLGAAFSVWTGLNLHEEDSPVFPTHRNLGIATLSLSFLALLAHFLRNKWKAGVYLRTIFYLAAAICVGFTGYYGGEMTHGDEHESSEHKSEHKGKHPRIRPPRIRPPRIAPRKPREVPSRPTPPSKR